MRVGVDEAGRGAACGPLVVAAAALHEDGDWSWIDRDSKRLSTSRRSETLVRALRMGARYVVQLVPAIEIDEYRGTLDELERLAAECALSALLNQPEPVSRVTADGKLFEGMDTRGIELACEPKTDERYPEVALASIAAKLRRDDEWFGICERHDIKLHGWGYPTSSMELQIREWMSRNPGRTFPELRRSWSWAKTRGLIA